MTVNTDAQHLAKLCSFWKQHSAVPSMQKLCDVVGLQSTASVFGLAGRLAETGYVSRVEGRIAPGNKFFERQVVGRVGAGQPHQAVEEDFDVLTINHR